MAVVQLAGNQAPLIAPLEQTVAATLGDTVELSGQPAEVDKPHSFNGIDGDRPGPARA